MDCVLDAVLKDVGIGYAFEPQVRALLGQSKLVRVPEEWCLCPPHRASRRWSDVESNLEHARFKLRIHRQSTTLED